MSDNEPLVHIRVTVNINSMRRGQELQVPLTEHIEGLSLAGYIQILGHVHPPAQTVVDPPARAEVATVAEFLAKSTPEIAPRPKRKRSMSPEVSDGGSEGSP